MVGLCHVRTLPTCGAVVGHDGGVGRTIADLIRPLRRFAGRIEALEVRWLGFSVLSVLFRQRVLVLETTGRRSGKQRRTTVAYRLLDGHPIIVGGAGGQSQRPDWVANLVADPNVVVTRDRRTTPMTATVLDGADRRAAWGRLVPDWPIIAKYEARAGRPIPVIRLR